MSTSKSNSTLYNLIAILQDGKCHDGTTIGGKLNMTRSAVWKIIEKLRSHGIEIHSTPGSGYTLTSPLILLNKNKIKKLLNNKSIKIDLFESIGSTNDYLKKHQPNATLKICLAEHQSSGRGRLQRTWHSPFAENIYFSCLWSFEKDVSVLSGLSLIIGLAIAEVLNDYTLKNSALVKWPNDVVCQNKKIAGNLIELEAESNGSCRVIIGIGINVNMLDVDNTTIAKPWTSLRLQTGRYMDRNQLTASLINKLEWTLKKFATHGLSYFSNNWKELDYLFGKTIELQNMEHKIQGTMQGINDQGHLLLQLKNGNSKAFSSGDTTICSS